MLRNILKKGKSYTYFVRRTSKPFSTSKEGDDNKGFLTYMKEVFQNKTLEQTSEKISAEEKQEINYDELARKVQDLSLNNADIQKQLIEIHQSITKAQEESYNLKDIEQLLSSVSSTDLCHFAVEQFIGSISIPKNEKIMKMFLEFAVKNARTKEEELEVEYYSLYLRKLQAIQSGNKEEFAQANEELLTLCNEKQHSISMHVVAKEIYKVGLNILNTKEKKHKKQYFAEAYDLFGKAAEKGSFHSFYYMGEMAESGDIPGGVDLKLAFEYYLLAASHDCAQAFFKLAKLEGFIEKKNPDLEYFYTKQAAELGLTEAQHNLACMYLDGKIVNYNSLKALSWFSYAGAAGFSHSQYNAAKIYIEGGKDGKVKQNLNAALVWLERIHKDGKIDVNNLIHSVNEMLEEQGENIDIDQDRSDLKTTN